MKRGGPNPERIFLLRVHDVMRRLYDQIEEIESWMRRSPYGGFGWLRRAMAHRKEHPGCESPLECMKAAREALVPEAEARLRVLQQRVTIVNGIVLRRGLVGRRVTP